MIIIGVNGEAGSGKDTFATAMIDHQNSEITNSGGFSRYAFANPIRRGLNAMFDIPFDDMLNPDVKNQNDYMFGRSIRYMAQTLGTEWARDIIHPDVWLLLAERFLNKSMQLNYSGVIITDCRFENEVDWIHSVGGYVIRIVRPNNNFTSAVAASGVSGHKSEGGVPASKIDITIVNDGTPDDMVKTYLNKMEWMYNG